MAHSGFVLLNHTLTLLEICLATCLTAYLIYNVCTPLQVTGPKISETVIGIDLGTTYACVGVYRDGQVEVIPNEQGNQITPTYVSFTAQGERLIGDAAKLHATINPENTVFDIKRLIGRQWNDPYMQSYIKRYPFKVVEENNKPYIQVNTFLGSTTFAPEEIYAMILAKLKKTAENYLNENITYAVVTVPADFSNDQRQATMDAATIAGLRVVNLINEPTSAAMAYGLHNSKQERNVLVFDLGAGTFDISLVEFDNGVHQILASYGDNNLGCRDLENRVMEYLIKKYKRLTGEDIWENKFAVQKLRREVERAKRLLSTATKTHIEIENFLNGMPFNATLTRDTFEDLTIDLLGRVPKLIQTVLKDANTSVAHVDEIVLVGGCSMIPMIRQLITSYFNGKAPRQGKSPLEAVAIGAAIQAGIYSGQNKNDIVLLDVSSRSLGIEVNEKQMEHLILKNTIIPTKQQRVVVTAEDDQTNVAIKIYEGDKNITARNQLLDIFVLDGIFPRKKGDSEVEVTFEINAMGILRVTALDRQNGNKMTVTVTSRHRLKAEQIDRMILRAESFAKMDAMHFQRFKAREVFEMCIYEFRSQFLDMGTSKGVISMKGKNMLKAVLEDAINWLDRNKHAGTTELKLKQVEVERDINFILMSTGAKTKTEL